MGNEPDSLETLAYLWEEEPSHEPDPGRTVRGPDASHSLPGIASLPVLSETEIELGATIGEGGMGLVRLAIQTSLGREVAVKTLRADRDSTGARRRMLLEAWVTGALEHPNVVPVHEVGRDADGRPFLVLKRIEGEPWTSALADASRIPARARSTDPMDWHLRVLLRVCDALAFAHARGVLHRDLKPDNVMIGAFGEVYLVDWGLAVALDADAGPRIPRASATSGRLIGTPLYMPPELLDGGRDPKPATDIWLLGAVLYEITHGKAPHYIEGAKGREGIIAIVERVRTTDPVLDPELSDEVRRLLARALQRDPADRHDSVEAFRSELADWVSRRAVLRTLADANAHLAELEGLVAETHGHDEEQVHTLLGACRFGFRSALESWPECPGATDGLDRALAATARHHLHHGEWHAAATLLAEARRVPDDLAEVVARARATADAGAERATALARAADPKTAARERFFVTVGMGVVWTLGLGVEWYRIGNTWPTYWDMTLGAVSFAIISAALAALAFSRGFDSDLNRQATMTVLSTPWLQVMLVAACWTLDMPRSQMMVMHLVSWATIAWVFTVACYRGFWPASIGFTLAVGVAALRPEWCLGAMTFAIVGLTLRLLQLGSRDLRAASE